MLKPSNLARERAAARAGASYALKADVSQFYPSLYTHAVGWAIDPKLRKKANWRNTKLLGKKLDQALMDLDRRISQGVPIGPDLSFLLAEIVLAQVDRSLRVPARRAVRWFDDYEVAFDSRDEAEKALRVLGKGLARYNLRLNPKKTRIIPLPCATQDEWQQVLKDASERLSTPNDMVRFFDTAFQLRESYPDAPVLLYAVGMLFKLRAPSPSVGRIAESCITQAILSEPGAAQKAFALLSFWYLNGYFLDRVLIGRTIENIVVRHQPSGFSSDVAWRLAFCLEQSLPLSGKAAKRWSILDDDCIALQALHMSTLGLLPRGFSDASMVRALSNADLDREHWLLAYESVRQNFLGVCSGVVANNVLFADLLANGVTFYRSTLPTYSTVIHVGGAPDWIIKKWVVSIIKREQIGPVAEEIQPLIELLGKDMDRLRRTSEEPEEIVQDLLDIETEELQLPDDPTYWV